MHMGEPSYVASIGREASCILTIDIGYRFRHAIRQACACEDVAAIVTSDQRVHVAQHVCLRLACRATGCSPSWFYSK